MSDHRIPLHQRLTIRIGLVVVVGTVLFEILSVPLWPMFGRWMDSGDGDADLAWLTVKWILLIAGYGVAYALLLSMALYLLVTRRIRRLAREATSPIKADSELPGPFESSGRDEIAQLAASMNLMRSRITELVDQLESREREQREWSAQVSHDLRTPLSALTVALSQLQVSRTENDRLANEATLLQAALTSAARVRALSEDLLELARLDSKASLQREAVLPAELARQTMQLLAPVAASRGIDLSIHLDEGLPTLQGDGHRLARALENLLANSIEHAESRVLIRVSFDGSNVEFRVEDDGMGLPDGRHEGEGLLQLNRQSRPDSAGLGLVVTTRISAAHNGQLTAENRLDGGASFTMSLPKGDANTPLES